jgi:Antidote-toxin recognition MazE, bacterial antitoxin
METAKLFVNGNSQAVRLPKEYRFRGDEVVIKRLGNVAEGRSLAGDVRRPGGIPGRLHPFAGATGATGAGAYRVKILLDTDICIHAINRRGSRSCRVSGTTASVK